MIGKNALCPKKINVWRSQAEISGKNIPAVNLLLCFAILAAGGSAGKVFRVFPHMGLACIPLVTFFKHQKVSIIHNYGLSKLNTFFFHDKLSYSRKLLSSLQQR